jgi:hypothetical protein
MSCWRRNAPTFVIACTLIVFGDPLGIKRLPDKFTEFVDGDKPVELQLWEARCGFCR